MSKIIIHPVAILREFTTRNGDAIGKVRLTGDAGLAIDGKELPAASVEYLLTFALQSLQDAYAGKADKPDEARAAFEAKLAKIISGEIGTRGPGASVPLETRIARDIMRDIFRVKASAEAKAAYKAADADGRNAIIDELIAKNKAAIDKRVAEELAKRKALTAEIEL
jgi:hypothetical protein